MIDLDDFGGAAFLLFAETALDTDRSVLLMLDTRTYQIAIDPDQNLENNGCTVNRIRII